MDSSEGILLESGTNELEIVEFGVADHCLGINVIKVKEILNVRPVTTIPHTHASVEGVIDVRGEVIPVIDMARVLNRHEENRSETQRKFILTEFNQMKVIFHVDYVNRIRRFKWEDIKKPDDMYQGVAARTTGVIRTEEELVLLLDFEHIIAAIHPGSRLQIGNIQADEDRERSLKRILIAEDSEFLRSLLKETLQEAGYLHLDIKTDGKQALDHLHACLDKGGDIVDEYQLIITDIEMPQMDGHHLTYRIKNTPSLQALPVIIFSSLITEDLIHKGKKVGADGQVSKPDIEELVKMVDDTIL
ncbi:chemotaxis protein [Thalassobacillus sp. CUG 92003]|uniref:chemotaxis protein n=1 Tax=Thalassobacillus sp. CUG 92003 TaxID=2736641 RepID=UPI0015E65479|nr:chemotaxis protein [Thalassobacillus sp. CUG 92003]